MVNLRVQAGSTLSNVDIIKLHLYYEGPSTPDELASEVARLMRSSPDKETALKKYVLPVLASQPLFVKKGGKYAVDIEQLPEHKVILEVFEESRQFLSEKDLKNKIAKALGIKVLSVAIDPSRVKGLKLLVRKWGLKHWRLINDDAFKVLNDRKASMTEKEIIKAVVELGAVKEDEAIFDPSTDKRFVRDRKAWRVATDDEEKAKKAKKSKLKAKGKVDKQLETDFVKSQVAKDLSKPVKRESGEKLKKVLIKKIVSEKLRESQEAPPVIQAPDKIQEHFLDLMDDEKQEIVAKEDFDKVTSYQRVEDSPRDLSLSQKERAAINAFLEKLATSKEFSPLTDHPVSASGPLSAPRVERLLYQRYSAYSMKRTLIPDEYNRMLVEVLDPKVTDLVLNPALQVGGLAVALLNYLHEQMTGMYWALGDGDTIQFLTQRGEKLFLDARDTVLIEKVKEEFVLNRNELLDNFIEYNFCGIDTDPVLTQAAKIITRLSGYEGVYLVNRNFLTELPEVFGQTPNPENDIDLVFNVILGNATFRGDHNIVANYIDQATRLLTKDGRVGYFLRWDFLQLMDGHPFLEMILGRHYFDTILKLTAVPSDVPTAIVILKPRFTEDSPPIRFGVLGSSTEIPKFTAQLRGDSAADALSYLPQSAFSDILK